MPLPLEASSEAFKGLEEDDRQALEEVRWLHVGDQRLPPLVEVPLRLSVGEKHFERLVKPPSVEALWEWYEELETSLQGNEYSDRSIRNHHKRIETDIFLYYRPTNWLSIY